MSIRIGIIGAGTMAQDHAAALVEVASARLVAIADPLLERAQALAARHHATAYADYRDLLDGVDAVWICTPPFLHREQAETCAAAGKHLFVEKPLALTVADAAPSSTRPGSTACSLPSATCSGSTPSSKKHTGALQQATWAT